MVELVVVTTVLPQVLEVLVEDKLQIKEDLVVGLPDKVITEVLLDLLVNGTMEEVVVLAKLVNPPLVLEEEMVETDYNHQ